MKLIEKLKNALFEEEYVEVEEKPKKQQKIKPKIQPKPQPKKEEKPIAKKIVSTEKKEYIPNVREEVELKDEDFEIEVVSDRDVLTDKNDFKFPVVEESDFKMEDTMPITDTVIEKEEPKLYQASKKEANGGAYGIGGVDIPKFDYSSYEKSEDNTYFKPSPIISPIYGVLDKNYKKEEVVTRKETRTSPSFIREHLDVDAVRKKAFGTLSDDIESGGSDLLEHEEDVFVEPEENDLLLDLNENEDAPEVKKVTVGDAEEYFEDLGLEYNVDYKDAAKEKATGRRSDKKEYEEEWIDTKSYENTEEIPSFIEQKKEASEDDEDDNLFDLIDSMYESE